MQQSGSCCHRRRPIPAPASLQYQTDESALFRIDIHGGPSNTSVTANPFQPPAATRSSRTARRPGNYPFALVRTRCRQPCTRRESEVRSESALRQGSTLVVRNRRRNTTCAAFPSRRWIGRLQQVTADQFPASRPLAVSAPLTAGHPRSSSFAAGLSNQPKKKVPTTPPIT